jgi:hypothetical protein
MSTPGRGDLGDEGQGIILTDAHVVCCDPLDTIVDTVGIRAGRIVATGDMSSVADAMGDGCRVVGLDGATVIPGLIDTHPHLMGFALVAEPLVDLADAVDHHDIGTRIAAKAAETPPGEWVMTTPVGEAHYFLRRSYRDLTEGEIPDRRVLDRAAPDHPVFVQAWAPVTPNVCAFNSRALDLLGIDHTTPDRVENVWIEKDADGEPTGRLHGSVTNYYNGDPFMESLLLQVPIFQLGLIGQATTRAMRAYNALGVTTVYEGHTMDFPLLDAYRALRADGELSVRVLCAPDAILVGIPGIGPFSQEQLLARLEQAAATVDRTDDLLRFDGVTVGRAGPCGPGWVLLREPYRGPYGEPTSGRSFVTLDEAGYIIDFCASRGLRLNMMVLGNGELDGWLEQLEKLDGPPATGDRPWIVQHAAVVEPDQIERLAALEIDLTASMSFSWGKGDLFAERVGEHILEHLVPLQRLLDAGLRVGCGSDWGPKNAFEHMALAVEPYYAGSGRKGATPGIARHAALHGWTRGAADVLCWEGIGSIVPGNHADVTIVDQDPVTCPLDRLPDTTVLATLLGGHQVSGTALDGVPTPTRSR